MAVRDGGYMPLPTTAVSTGSTGLARSITSPTGSGYPGSIGSVDVARSILSTAYVGDAALEREVRAGEAQLRTLTNGAHGDAELDEASLFRLISAAHLRIQELHKKPGNFDEDTHRFVRAALDLCSAWFRLMAGGLRLHEGGKGGLRSPSVADMVCAMVATLLTTDLPSSDALLLGFNESGGLGLFGSALCHFGEASLPEAVKKLRRVAAGCGKDVGRDIKRKEVLARNVEAFRSGLVTHLSDLSRQPDRKLRVRDFKDLVEDVIGILACVYLKTQALLMGQWMVTSLASSLAAFCEGVEEQDAIAAVDWLAETMNLSLKQGQSPSGTMAELDVDRGALHEGLKDRIADVGLWGELLLHAGCSTIRHAQEVFKVLLSKKLYSPCELIRSLQQAGAFPPSHITASSRLSMQQALLAAMASLDTAAMTELFTELSGILEFEHLDQEGIDLLVRVTQQAFASGYRPTSQSQGAASAWQARSLAFARLLHYLQWGYLQPELPKSHLDFAHRVLLQTLAPHPALVPLLPSLAVEALALSASSAGAGEGGHLSRCVSALGNISVDAARTGVAATSGAPEASTHLAADAIGRLCQLLDSIRLKPSINFPPETADVWLSAFIDTLACYLRLPGAPVPATSQVNVLWQGLVKQPIFGLSVTNAASHYFKLAFLAQPASREALLKPLTPQAPPEVYLVKETIFCPASFGDEKPPLTAGFFFPLMSEARSSMPAVQMVVHSSEAGSPPVSPLRSNAASTPGDILRGGLGGGNEAEVTAAANAAGVQLPPSSLHTPRLLLDRVQTEVSQEVFFELTGYDAIERRLWDEFAKCGRVDDTEALRQRDASAVRCRRVLEAAVSSAGRVASTVADALEKFKNLCDVIQARTLLLEREARLLQDCEESFAKAEDHYFLVRSREERETLRRKRRGDLSSNSTATIAAKDALTKANLALIVELRLLAARAQLGLPELLSMPGVARSLRAVGPSHCDPLLERLASNDAWLAMQAEGDAKVADVVSERESGASTKVTTEAKHMDDIAPDDPALSRPDGLAGYTDIRTISPGGHVSRAHRHGTPVALKAFAVGTEQALRREVRVLSQLRQSCVVSLDGIVSGDSQGTSYLEFAWCGGGNLYEWCERHQTGGSIVDAEAYVKALGLFRQVWLAVTFIHTRGAAHGDLALHHVLLTADHRPVLADFQRCYLADSTVTDWSSGVPPPSYGYEAPEVAELSAAGAVAAPTQAADIYAAGVMMAKAFLGLSLEVSACQIDARTGLRDLPEERADVDLADLLQATVAQEPGLRLTAAASSAHRGLDPAGFLRRQGLLGSNRASAQGLLTAAEQLREEFRGRRVDEPLIFNRDEVFNSITSSKLHEWAEEALLGEWRVVLDTEGGVDAGGLRREVVTLFFEQLERSNLVDRVGADGPGVQPTIFVADRQRAGRSPQEWRQTWMAVGAMVLRSVAHFGNAPVLFSSVVFDCAFGRLARMPPDEGMTDSEQDGGVAALCRLRDARGDDWARSELLDLLRRLRRADPQKDSSYRWLLGQRTIIEGSEAHASRVSTSASFMLSADSLETISYMLAMAPYKFLVQNSQAEKEGSMSHTGAVMEWALLWDLYLKYVGDGDRWTAYEAFALGLSARGRRRDLWVHLTGQVAVEALEGSALTPEAVLDNLEYKPGYGYDSQIQFFKNVLGAFTAPELSLFLRFATGIGRLPTNGRFPSGQKLTIRFMPDQQERLPTAHTCFWVVDVPPYEDELDLEQKLRQAIAAPQPFTFS